MNAPSASPVWLGSGALVLAAHGAVLAGLALMGVRMPESALPEPVVLIELPPLAASAPQPQQVVAVAQPQPDPVVPQNHAPRVEAPPVTAPIPREVVAVQPPQPQPQPVRVSAAAQPQVSLQSTPSNVTGPGEAQGDDPRAQQQEADYRSLVRSYVARNRFSPPQSRRAGLSGDIGVRFSVNRRGDISEVVVARSSGHDLLDGEAVEFIRRLANVPAFPRDLRRSEIPLTITLRFALERR